MHENAASLRDTHHTSLVHRSESFKKDFNLPLHRATKRRPNHVRAMVPVTFAVELFLELACFFSGTASRTQRSLPNNVVVYNPSKNVFEMVKVESLWVGGPVCSVLPQFSVR